MADKNQVQTACYQAGGGKWAIWLGIALIVIGAILLIFCVPLWAWLAVIGAVLIIVGIVLLRK